MNKYFYISIIIAMFFCGNKIFSQNSLYIGGRAVDITCDTITGQTNESKQDSIVNSFLQGRTGPQFFTIYPLTDDINLKQNKKPILYPLLVVNNVIISDTTALNCFRNHFDRVEIKKIKHVSKKKAEKMGIPNIPQDGVLFVVTKKDYYFDFFCE